MLIDFFNFVENFGFFSFYKVYILYMCSIV